MVYPALGLITPLCVYSSEWGPIVFALVWVGRKLRRMGLVLRVLGWHLGGVAVLLLQKGVEVVLVLLVRRGQMRAGPLPLVPLSGLQTVGLLRLEFLGPWIALADRDAAADAVLAGLLRGVLLFVAREAQAAAEALLGLLDVDGGRLRVVRAPARLVVAGRRLGRVDLGDGLLVGGGGAGGRQVGGVSVARGAVGEGLAKGARGHAGGDLGVWRLLCLRNLLGALGRWIAIRAGLVDCEHLLVSRTTHWTRRRSLTGRGAGGHWRRMARGRVVDGRVGAVRLGPGEF